MAKKPKVSDCNPPKRAAAMSTPLERLVALLDESNVVISEAARTLLLSQRTYGPVIKLARDEMAQLGAEDRFDDGLLLMPPPRAFCLRTEVRAGLLMACSVSGALSVAPCPFPSDKLEIYSDLKNATTAITDADADLDLAQFALISAKDNDVKPASDVCSELRAVWKRSLERIVLPGLDYNHPGAISIAMHAIDRWIASALPNLADALRRINYCALASKEIEMLAGLKQPHPAIRAIDLDMISMHKEFDADPTMPKYRPTLQGSSLFAATEHLIKVLRALESKQQTSTPHKK